MHKLDLTELTKIKGGYPCPPLRDPDNPDQPVNNGEPPTN